MAAPDFERAVLGAVLLNPTHWTEIAVLRRHFSEAERDAAGYEAEQVNRITRAEDIPDPFACESDEIGWVVSGLIPARGITIIAGEAGAGKTWLALALARATTVGGNF